MVKSLRRRVRIRASLAIGAIASAIIGAGSLTVCYAQLAGSVWPAFRHDLRHTGLSSADTSANPGTLKWVFPTIDQPEPSPAIGVSSSPAIASDGTIYVGGDIDLYAVNPDGTMKWKFPTGSLIEHSSPAIGADGTIYIGSYDHSLYAVTDGGQGVVTKKWAFATGDAVDTSPAIGPDGTIYFGSADNTLYAVNSDGTLKWKFASGAPIEDSSPAIGDDGTIYIGSFENNL